MSGRDGSLTGGVDRTTEPTQIRRVGTVVLLAHAILGWALCGAIMGVAMSRTSVKRALWIHAIGAPIVFGLLSLLYFMVFSFTSPLVTAVTFVGVVIAMDVGVVAPFIEKSYAMFRSPLGTWIPFGLILVTTYVVGLVSATP